jgi:two-component system sensor histidine kinase TctE
VIKSLRWQLLLWLLIPLTMLLAINSIMTHRTAVAAANAAYDRTLLASARAIAERITVTNSDLSVDLPYVALEMFESSMRDRIFYRVSLANGQLVTGYADLPAPGSETVAPYKPVVYETGYQGERIRVAALSKPLYDPQLDGPVLIQVAETLESRRALTRELLSEAAWRQAGLIVFASLLVWLGVQWGLKPLLRLSREIAERKQTDLMPIDKERVQTEVRPLVQAVNVHMARLESLICAQQRFIADASHQLKTPLTLLNTQAEFALRQDSPAAMRSVVGDLHKNTHQVVRLASQLLMLARAEPDSRAPHDLASVELAAVARSVCLECSPAAVKKQIDLGFDGPEQDSSVIGNGVLLRELIANLVDNAIRYTQPG